MTDPEPTHTALLAERLLADIEWRTEDDYRAEMDRNWWSE